MNSISSAATITVIGNGRWGQTLAHLAIQQDHSVRLWGRSSPESLADHLVDTQIVISAVSMPGVLPMIQQLQTLNLPKDLIVVSATKGLDPESLQTPVQLWQQAFPDHPVVVLSGPNLSKEIQQGLPAATVVASHSTPAATSVQKALSSDRFRIYTSPDPLGVELGGSLKNVIAIAAGVCDGLQLGTNAKAALITRGLAEMIRMGTHLGARAETFFGLSGLGDLLATCNSSLSRNYQVGYRLAQGQRWDQMLGSIEGTAEGINTAHVLVDLAEQEHIPMPIGQQVCRLLDQQISPQQAVAALMERSLKSE